MRDNESLLRNRMDRRTLLRLVGLAGGGAALSSLMAACGAAAPAAAPPQVAGSTPVAAPTSSQSLAGATLTVYDPGNAADGFQLLSQQLLEPKTGAKIAYVPGSSAGIIGKVIAEKASPQSDIIANSADSFFDQLLAEGVIDVWDTSKIPSVNDLYPLFMNRMTELKNYFIPTTYTAPGLGYRSDKITDDIKSWNQLWDPKYRGHVVWGPPESNFNYSLIQIAARLKGNEDDVELGVQKLLELKPNLLTVTTSIQAITQLMASGDAWIAMIHGGQVKILADQGLPVKFVAPEEGAIGDIAGNYLTKGTKQSELAHIFTEVALSPEGEKLFHEKDGLGPANSKAQLSTEFQPYIPTGPDALTKWKQINWPLLTKDRAKTTERIKAELAR